MGGTLWEVNTKVRSDVSEQEAARTPMNATDTNDGLAGSCVVW